MSQLSSLDEAERLLDALDRFSGVLEKFLDYTITVKLEKNT